MATDATGLAVIQNLPVGTVSFQLSSGSVDLSVVQEKELYDLVLSYISGGVEEIVSAIRYPLGGTIVNVKPGDDLSTAVVVDGAIVFMAPGFYEGDLEVTSEGVLLFGSWDSKESSMSIINGNLTVKGGNACMRGLTMMALNKLNKIQGTAILALTLLFRAFLIIIFLVNYILLAQGRVWSRMFSFLKPQNSSIFPVFEVSSSVFIFFCSPKRKRNKRVE